ncbi:DNA fragmentation factor subunit alpha isoform X2 [Natator depressus]|uniref:DNA fragmentation factor subunit alpha isoform X2 n=1 Tax=Natator depressus TaxID=27790 RepID=UPI003EBDABE3
MAGEAPGSGEGVSPRRQCLIRRKSQREHHGVAASCLRELRSKACDILAIDKAWEPITLVLAEDGTIVDDEDYFLCLPPNTKFVALARNEKWTSSSTDGGTAWLSRESIDEVDSGESKWKHLARQLKDDLSSIILMSEEDLQVLIDVPCSDLAQELSQNQPKTQMLQDTLQQALDRREEERQSKQLLELYMKALKNEGSILTKASEPDAAPREEMNVVNTDSSSAGASAKRSLSSGILAALKEKPAPELSLDSQDLEQPPSSRRQKSAEETGRVVDVCGTLRDKSSATSYFPASQVCFFFLWAGAKLPAQLFLYYSSPSFLSLCSDVKKPKSN